MYQRYYTACIYLIGFVFSCFLINAMEEVTSEEKALYEAAAKANIAEVERILNQNPRIDINRRIEGLHALFKKVEQSAILNVVREKLTKNFGPELHPMQTDYADMLEYLIERGLKIDKGKDLCRFLTIFNIRNMPLIKLYFKYGLINPYRLGYELTQLGTNLLMSGTPISEGIIKQFMSECVLLLDKQQIFSQVIIWENLLEHIAYFTLELLDRATRKNPKVFASINYLFEALEILPRASFALKLEYKQRVAKKAAAISTIPLIQFLLIKGIVTAEDMLQFLSIDQNNELLDRFYSYLKKDFKNDMVSKKEIFITVALPFLKARNQRLKAYIQKYQIYHKLYGEMASLKHSYFNFLPADLRSELMLYTFSHGEKPFVLLEEGEFK